MWLVSSKDNVRKVPGGTIKCPPPAFAMAATAFWKASVLSVLESDLAPKSERLNLASGMLGTAAVISASSACKKCTPNETATKTATDAKVLMPSIEGWQTAASKSGNAKRMVVFAADDGIRWKEIDYGNAESTTNR